jgi:hypothetical protein
MTEKVIIFDASTLISFAMNGLFKYLVELKKTFNGKFIITQEVKAEIIDRPLKIKRFELEAMQVSQLLLDKTLEFPSSLGISDEEITKETDRLLDLINSSFYEKDKSIHLVDLGEVSCLALGKMLNQKEIPNLLAIDERTARMICEKPENLRKLLVKKHQTTISYDKNIIKDLNQFKIIRSAELIYIIYKKGLVEIQNKKVLEAMLYALKYKGCSISEEEIEEMVRVK